jgi:hypothetical protein
VPVKPPVGTTMILNQTSPSLRVSVFNSPVAAERFDMADFQPVHSPHPAGLLQCLWSCHCYFLSVPTSRRTVSATAEPSAWALAG